MADTLLVRIKPFNPRRGYVMRSHIDGPTGAQFKEERGWYEVPKAVGERLKEVTSKPLSPESPLAFDVCTREEAIALEKRARAAAQERASASDPLSVNAASRDHLGGRTSRFPAARDGNTLTTADLPNGQRVTKDELHDEPADEADLESEDLAAEVAKTSAKASSKAKGGGRKATSAPAVPGAPKAAAGSLLPGAPTGDDGEK